MSKTESAIIPLSATQREQLENEYAHATRMLEVTRITVQTIKEKGHNVSPERIQKTLDLEQAHVDKLKSQLSEIE